MNLGKGILANFSVPSLSSQIVELMEINTSMGSATCVDISWNSFCRGSSSRQAADTAMYSASMVLKAVDVWSLLPQVTGQLLTQYKVPCARSFTVRGSFIFSLV